MTTVVITGAGGNIGTKLRRHFEGLGWTLKLLDARAPDKAVQVADLSVWDDGWAGAFLGCGRRGAPGCKSEPAHKLGQRRAAQF